MTFASFLVVIGDGENGFLLEHRVSVRKSVSNTQQETNRRTSDTSPSNMKPIKAKEVSPKSGILTSLKFHVTTRFGLTFACYIILQFLNASIFKPC